MILLLKAVIFLVLLCIGNIFLVCFLDGVGFLTSSFVIFLIIEIFVAVFLFMYVAILKPLGNLYDSLNVIDFDKDIIDFSKLDSLSESGTKEVQLVIRKFKYLLDIITERINKVNSETYKSEHDSLTGCFNRARLENVKSMYEYAKAVAIVFIDVNNLKRMNDDFGHEAGDALLKSAAYKLNYWTNYGDVYRMGGDEFMVVVVNKSPEYVNKLVSHWYPTVGQLNRDSDGFKCVLSYGVAYGSQGCNFDALQKQADDKMYEMKVALKKKFGEPLR